MQSHSPEHIILETKRLVESDNRSEIRLNANGGNCIIIACEPNNELNYIKAIKTLMPIQSYEIIDLNALLIEFVKTYKMDIDNSFDILRGSIDQIFKIPNGEEGSDLFDFILKAIAKSLNSSKIPVLINAGTLYGSGIDNIHIMENELVMKAPLPLIILYPSTRDGENLLFLGKRPSSRYRCMIVELK